MTGDAKPLPADDASPARDGRMRMTVIGCSGSLPGPDSAASCYLVEAPYAGRTYRLLLDLGSGALGALQRHVDLETIDAVALTHLHPDHFFDLCALYVVRKYHPRGSWPPLAVVGPEGTARRLAAAYGAGADEHMSDQFTFSTYPAGPFQLGPFSVRVARVEHPVAAPYAISLEFGRRRLVYSGDTAPCAALESLATGCDLLLAEATFLERDNNPSGVHLTGRQAADAASRAGVDRLVLTHVPPWHAPDDVLAEAAPHFTGDLQLARSGACFDV